MPALNFTAHNAPLVREGRKPTTIRAMRKRPFRQGDYLKLFTGQRTSGCRSLGEASAAIVYPVTIDPTEGTVTINGRVWQSRHLLQLAQAEGFDSVLSFFEFFRAGLAGQIIGWGAVTYLGQTVPTTLDELNHYWEK